MATTPTAHVAARARPRQGRTAPRHSIVVGVDDSSGSTAAVDWAAREAVSRRVPLEIVSAWEWQRVEPWSHVVDRIAIADRQHAAHTVVSRYLAAARAYEGIEAADAVAEGYPPDVLVGLSKNAGMIVVGSHHLSGLGRAVMGSVSTSVVSRADCPVVVVRGPRGWPAEEPAVVVGVAGEPDDERVLAFGFERAARLGLPLRAIFGWDPMLVDRRIPIPQRAQLWLAESIAGWRERFPDVEVHPIVVRAHPVQALIEQSAAQDLLVVGRHARRARFGAVLGVVRLGSVSLGVLHHAACPVAVIPPPEQPAVR